MLFIAIFSNRSGKGDAAPPQPPPLPLIIYLIIAILALPNLKQINHAIFIRIIEFKTLLKFRVSQILCFQKGARVSNRDTGCSLNIVLFFKDFEIFRTLAFFCFPSVYTHQAGRTPAPQQYWQSSEKSQKFKENTIFNEHPVQPHLSVKMNKSRALGKEFDYINIMLWQLGIKHWSFVSNNSSFQF